jgi:hypothetical protein
MSFVVVFFVYVRCVKVRGDFSNNVGIVDCHSLNFPFTIRSFLNIIFMSLLIPLYFVYIIYLFYTQMYLISKHRLVV